MRARRRCRLRRRGGWRWGRFEGFWGAGAYWVCLGGYCFCSESFLPVWAAFVVARALLPYPFGLSLSKPWRYLGTDRAEVFEAGACWFERRAWVECGGRESPGARVTFFRVAERKSPKKGRSPVCVPCAALRGKPASGRLRGAPWNSLCCYAAPLGQPRRVRARSTRAPTRVPPHNRPAAGAASRGWGAEQPKTQTAKQPNSQTAKQPNSQTAKQPNSHSGLCFARPPLAGASATRCAGWAERSDGPCGCPIRGFPSVCAWGAQGAGWHARRSAHAS